MSPRNTSNWKFLDLFRTKGMFGGQHGTAINLPYRIKNERIWWKSCRLPIRGGGKVKAKKSQIDVINYHIDLYITLNTTIVILEWKTFTDSVLQLTLPLLYTTTWRILSNFDYSDDQYSEVSFTEMVEVIRGLRVDSSPGEDGFYHF